MKGRPLSDETHVNDSTPQLQPKRRWVSRAETIAAFVLAVLFLAWVGAIFVQQRLTGTDIDIVRNSAETGRYKVDLNQADKGELMLLPGIGEVRSDRILAWRAEHGRFLGLDEVKAASGLSDSALDAIRDLVTLGDTQTE